MEAPHPPQSDGSGTIRFLPAGLQLSVLGVTCLPLDRAPSAASVLALVGPHGDPSPIELAEGWAVLSESTDGLESAVVELGDSEAGWQCRCVSADHLWRESQALGMCLSLARVP